MENTVVHGILREGQCKPQFYYIKVVCKGVFVTRTCFRDENLTYQAFVLNVSFVTLRVHIVYCSMTFCFSFEVF